MRAYIFLLVFLVSLLIQGTLWRHIVFTDEAVWLQRIAQLQYDLSHQHYDAANPVYSGHPGMSFTTIGALAHEAGVPLRTSLQGSVSLLVAFSAATVALLCWMLKPQNLWWLPASAIVAANPLYLHASPTNAVVAPLSVIIVLLGLWLYEHARHSQMTSAVVGWGATIGLAATTRLDTTILIAGPLLLFLFPYLGWRRTMLIGGTGAAIAVGSNPLLWYTPWQHIRYIFFRSGLNYTDAVIAAPLTFEEFVLFAPFALLSLMIALLFVTSRLRTFLPFSRSFVLLILTITVVFTAILLNVRYQSVRHFHPIIFVWEIFLPLFLLTLITHVQLSFTTSTYIQLFFQRTVRIGIIVLLTIIPIFLLIYSYLLPARNYLVDWQSISLSLTHHQ